MSWLRTVAAGLSPWRTKLDSRSVNVGFEENRAGKGQGFLPRLPFSRISVISPMLCTHISFVHHRRRRRQIKTPLHPLHSLFTSVHWQVKANCSFLPHGVRTAWKGPFELKRGNTTQMIYTSRVFKLGEWRPRLTLCDEMRPIKIRMT